MSYVYICNIHGQYYPKTANGTCAQCQIMPLTTAYIAPDLEIELQKLRKLIAELSNAAPRGIDELESMRREEQLMRQDAQDKLKATLEELERYKVGSYLEAKAGYETRAQLQIATEALKDVIRNSYDILAKKRCSAALQEIEGSEK